MVRGNCQVGKNGAIALIFLSLAMFWSFDSLSAAQTQSETDLAVQDEFFMGQVLELARLAVKHGNHPFGAVLVKDGKVMARSENTVITDRARSHHAEINVIDKAFRELNVKSLEGYTLYTSTEPCIACCGAIFLTKVSTVVYGAPHEFMAKLLPGYLAVGIIEMRNFLRQDTVVRGPVMKEHAEKILSDFMADHPERARH